MKRSLPISHTVTFLLMAMTVWLFVLAPLLSIAQVGGNLSLLTFGSGKTKVRLYSDYFCGACSRLEPQLEPIITDLVKRNIITITFVDTPAHKFSPLYAQYFLAILNDKKEMAYALAVRNVLFDAARAGIVDKDKLEAFLAEKGIQFKPFDVKPVFAVLQTYLKEDAIKATPTAVFLKGDKKESFQGVESIVKALKNLK